MRWGWIPALALVVAAAAPAAAQTRERVRCGATVAPWRLTVPAPLTARTCAKQVGLHGGEYRTRVFGGTRLVLELVAPHWWPPPRACRLHADTPLPLDARTQWAWWNGARYRVRVLDRSAAVRAVLRSLRFASASTRPVC